MNKFKNLTNWLHAKVAQKMLYSLKSTILSFYIPIIILFIFMTGTISYWLAAQQIEDNAYSNVQTIVFQTGNYLDNRFADVLQQLIELSNDPDVLSVINKDPKDISPEDYIRVQSHVNTIRSLNGTMIDSIYLNFHNNKFIFFRGDDPNIVTPFSYKQYRDQYKDNPYDIYWRNSNPSDANREENVSLFKLFGRGNAKINGIILFSFRHDFFEKVFSRSLLSKSGYLVLINKEGILTFKKTDSAYQMTPDVIQNLQQTKEKSGRIEFKNTQGENLVAIYETIPSNQWKLAAVFTQAEILDNVKYIKYITVFIIILLILIAVGLTNILAGYITKPISLLADHMKSIKGDNLEFVSSIHSINEIGVLDQGVQDLVQRVKVLLEQIKAEQESKRQLEFSVMQTQIHPHFLYNTLYSIQGLCDMGLTKDASAMVTALANFFRSSISCGKEIITVEEELSHIRNYLFIQEMRYGDVFSYEINVDSKLFPYSIVKLTLQPLVENAIYHGIKQKRGIGWIKVTGYTKDGFLYFEVEDNGLGMTPERLAEVRAGLTDKTLGRIKMGLGVRSVHERIQLYYGTNAGLKIDSELNIGTVMTVMIPMERKENLLEKVRNAASEWDAENRVQQKINAANPFFRREFLKKLMDGNGEETELRQDAMSLGIDLTGQTFIAFLIKIDEYHQDSMEMADFIERQKAFKFCVVNMCEEVTHSQRTGGVVELDQDELVLLYSSNETVQLAEENGRYLVEQIQKMVHRYLKTTVTIVLGGVHQGILGLRLSYQEARSLLDFRHFIGKDKIYSLSDIKLSSQQAVSLQTEDKVNELVHDVKLGLAQDAFMAIDDLEHVMIQEKQMSLYHVRLLSVWLVISLFRGSAEWASDWEHVQRKNMSLYYIRINEMQTIREIFNLIRSVVGDLAEFMAGKRESHRGGVIGEAVKYMEKHYVKQGLSLQDVASHIHINPVYLSTLFKQEKKITFSDFLLQVRMQKAMELLRNQDMKCYEVADMVGYNTPEYFSVCFKKHTGLSPIEFKNRL